MLEGSSLLTWWLRTGTCCPEKLLPWRGHAGWSPRQSDLMVVIPPTALTLETNYDL